MITHVTIKGAIDIRVQVDGDSYALVAMKDGTVEPFTADEMRLIAAELDKLDNIAALEADNV
jgi:hypothetical protein